MRKIGGVFGRSAFGPLHEHMIKVSDCVAELKPLVQAFVAGDRDEVDRRATDVATIEHEADVVKIDIRNALSPSVFAAVQRSEMMLLLSAQDEIADECEDAARLMRARNTRVTPRLGELFVELAAEVMETVALATAITERLDELAATGAVSDSIAEVTERVHKVAESEHATNATEEKLLAELFTEEDELGPVTVMVLAQVIACIGQIADNAENSAESIHRLVLAG